jgi:ribosomal protein S18 acetylase RimI-like enzyme
LKSKGWFKGIFNQSRDSIYIMTLGVIDEYRSSGLAQRLLKEIFNISERNIEIKFIYLHVVVYNERAIRFYQKNGFKILQKYSDYYHIFSLEYEGYLVGAFVNGG